MLANIGMWGLSLVFMALGYILFSFGTVIKMLDGEIFNRKCWTALEDKLNDVDPSSNVSLPAGEVWLLIARGCIQRVLDQPDCEKTEIMKKVMKCGRFSVVTDNGWLKFSFIPYDNVFKKIAVLPPFMLVLNFTKWRKAIREQIAVTEKQILSEIDGMTTLDEIMDYALEKA